MSELLRHPPLPCPAHALPYTALLCLQAVPSVVKAVAESPLKLTPRAEGQEVLVPIPRCAKGGWALPGLSQQTSSSSSPSPLRPASYPALLPGRCVPLLCHHSVLLPQAHCGDAGCDDEGVQGGG